ncbi:hypothetical protein KXV85_005489, partial [Aspergillus fumigatus]
ASDDKLLQLMAFKPGLFLEFTAIKCVEQEMAASLPLPVSLQRDILASAGVAGLIDAQAATDKGVYPVVQAGARFRVSAQLVLSEGQPGLPYLPLYTDGRAAQKYRNFMQVEPKAPLIALVIRNMESATDLLADMRRVIAAYPEAFLLVHTLDVDKKRSAQS